MRWMILAALCVACGEDAKPAPEGAEDASRDAQIVSMDAQPDVSDSATPDSSAPPDAGLAPDARPDAIPDAADAFVDPAAPIVGSGEWGPAARITEIEVPTTPIAARRAGCALYGYSSGTAVRNVFQVLGGGLSRFARPNNQGQIDLVMLVRVPEWTAGTSALELGRTQVQLLDGVHLGGDEFRIIPRSFVDGDPESGVNVVLAGVEVDDGWIQSQPSTVLVPLPLLSATTVQLELKLAQLGGRLAADGPGFRIDHGHLAGYFTDEGLVSLIEQVKVLCQEDAPPPVCALVGGQINQPVDVLVELVRGIVGDNDVWVTDTAARDCNRNEEACNAVAVCLGLSARGVEISGIAEP